jgi:hypothetical protein
MNKYLPTLSLGVRQRMIDTVKNLDVTVVLLLLGSTSGFTNNGNLDFNF